MRNRKNENVHKNLTLKLQVFFTKKNLTDRQSYNRELTQKYIMKNS